MRKRKIISILVIGILLIASYIYKGIDTNDYSVKEYGNVSNIELDKDANALIENIPAYNNSPSVVLNKGVPNFTDRDYEDAKEMFIELSELDSLGRTGECTGSLAEDTMPFTERKDISSVHPAGWVQAQYPDLISYNNGYLYNRGHLIMRALSGLEADARNLATLTVYCNEKGMLPYETAVCNYIEKYGGRILYRVTPIYKNKDLVPRGVHIEAGDVKSQGKNFHINVYCYNVQPKIEIDYKTGNSRRK